MDGDSNNNTSFVNLTCVGKSSPLALIGNHRSIFLLPSSSTEFSLRRRLQKPPPIPETSTTCPTPLLRPRATELPTVVIGHWVRRPVRRSGSRSRRSGRASGVLHATSILTPGSRHLEPRYATACEPDILGARFEQLRKGLLRCVAILVYARHFGSAPPAAYLQQSPGPNNILTTLVYVLRMHLVGCEVVGVPIASRNAQDENTCSVGRRTLPAGSTTAR